MYIKEIIEYLLWPVFILISWFAVNYALSLFNKTESSKAAFDNENEVKG